MVALAIGCMTLLGNDVWTRAPSGRCAPGQTFTGCYDRAQVYEGALRYLVVSAAAIAVVAAVGLLWRRLRGGGSWIRVSVSTATVGVLLGAAASRVVGAEGAMAAAYVTTAAVSLGLAAAWLGLIRPALHHEKLKIVGADR
jgi:hypothetical protein